jgi:signal transduction histidine kinase
MFRALRWRLTLLYLLTALALLAFTGVGAYVLLQRYFLSATDLTLQRRMAQEFRALGAAPPPALAAGEQQWLAARGRPAPGHDSDDGDDHHGGPASRDDLSGGDLGTVFVAALDSGGQVIRTGDGGPGPDASAVAAALATGSDWRTVRSGDDSLRLLTYRLPAGAGAAVLQAARPLGDQDRALALLLGSLLGLGGLSAALLGIGSWALAGRALAPAQRAWTRQQAFVANASHELRAPLTLLRAAAEVARRGAGHSPDQRALLDDVLGEADHMNRLVEDLLLLSRLDAGRLPVERQVAPLASLLGDAQRQVGRLAIERRVQVECAGADGAVWADPTRLRQALLIVLDNALRHTPAGGVIRLSAQPRDRQVAITVADTGSGIAAEHLPHVFERFYRASAGRGAGAEGSGLGLAIAKALIEAQHGQIRLESRVGEGTQVTFLLPRARTAAGEAGPLEGGAGPAGGRGAA